MKKFLALTIVAGSALGIAATTTACNNDQIKSQLELGLKAVYGIESGAKCWDTFFNKTETDTDNDTIVSAFECAGVNHEATNAEADLIKKIEFSNYKLIDNKDLTANGSITVKSTAKADDKETTLDYTFNMEKKDGGSVWLIKNVTEVTKA